MPRHRHQQVSRHIYDEMLYEEAKVDPPLPF
jgi:hypothetical protein